MNMNHRNRSTISRRTRRRKRQLRQTSNWLLIAVCTLILVAGGIKLHMDHSAIVSAVTARAENITEEVVALQNAFAQMDGDSELTEAEREALVQEAEERNAGGEEADSGQASALMEDLAALREKIPDLVGWMRIEGTVVDYPFVQGADNEYYLSHRFDGKASKAGAIFVDYRNEPAFDDQNTIVYGHHMKDGSMFASLVQYKQQDYYDQHPTMLLYTPEGNFLVEFFAGYTAPIRDEALPCFYMSYESEAEFFAYINEAKKRSTFHSDVAVGAEDRIITLSTCTYEIYDARYILQGKLTAMD